MPTLYHYTDVHGFFEIISKKKLWLSGTHNLNDHSELAWGKNVIYRVIDELNTLLIDDKKLLTHLFTSTCGFARFVCSLSQGRDTLSQWRAYADDGHGFAIGFDHSAFPYYPYPQVNARPADSAATLCKVVYSEQEQEDAAAKIVLALAKELRDSAPDTHSEALGIAAAKLAGLTVALKNPAFEEEHEWRLVYAPPIIFSPVDRAPRLAPGPNLLKQRVSKKRICTYFERSFAPSDVVSIVQGPKCQVHMVDLHILLADNGFDIVPTQSKATYR
ncbi:MAG: DUF2971 domain-containing protein [Pseudomonadota bacterium]